jgi:Ca2+/H+ antiporter
VPPPVLFFSAALAIVPIARLIGISTEQPWRAERIQPVLFAGWTMREEELVNVGTAVVLLAAYGLYLVFLLRTHPDFFKSVAAPSGEPHHEHGAWSPRALGSLVGASLLAAWMSEIIGAIPFWNFAVTSSGTRRSQLPGRQACSAARSFASRTS